MKCITCKNKLSVQMFEMRSDTKKLRNTCKNCRKEYVKNIKMILN